MSGSRSVRNGTGDGKFVSRSTSTERVGAREISKGRGVHRSATSGKVIGARLSGKDAAKVTPGHVRGDGTGPRVRPYIVDSSVWAHLPKSDIVQQRLRRAIDDGEIVMPTPILLELGFTARNPAAWDALMKKYSAFRPLAPTAATHQIAMELQGALWHGGKIRAAGAFDTLVAALAIEHDATVIHYDRDYEHIASVDSRLTQEWVAPRGTL